MIRATMLTLWDLLTDRPQPAARPNAVKSPIRPGGPRQQQQRPRPIQQRYDELVQEMKLKYGLRVRKWRSSTTGCAWIVTYTDGTTSRLIESPYPRGPMSCAVFLHEVGHHAIGLGKVRPRCLEEYEAWRWSLRMMHERGFNITEALHRRVACNLHYAVLKARRRGLKRLPRELLAFVMPPDGTCPPRIPLD